MKILSLHIDGFGKFHNRDISFQDGLNVVYGKNEAGKSTLHTFIKGMLFGIERQRGRASKNDTYSKFQPWTQSGVYEGHLRVECDGQIYRIERRFQKGDKRLCVINETTGKEEENNKALWDKLRCGLSETAYDNTISIGQLKCATDGGMVSELRNYIANLNTSGSIALNITKASAYLKAQRKQLEARFVPEAAKSYTAALSEIRRIEQEISAPEYANHLTAKRQERGLVKEELDKKQKEKEQLLEKAAKGRQILLNSQFTDQASVEKYRNETRQHFEDHASAKAACNKRSRSVGAFLLMFLAMLGIGSSLFFLLAPETGISLLSSLAPRFLQLSPATLQLPALLCGLCGILFLIAGIMLINRSRHFKKQLDTETRLLQEIFSRHLQDASISQKALDALEEKLAGFLRLSKAVEQSENTLKTMSEEISRLQQTEDGVSEEIEKQQRIQWELEQKLEQLAAKKNEAEHLKHVLAENKYIQEELDAVDLAQDTMTNLSTTIRDSFGLYLNKTASELIEGITGGIYRSMSIDQDLNIFMNTPTRLVPIEQVSSGTMDQIYLAVRLAAAKLVIGDKGNMPLIFDDSFALYDDDRLKTALKWLSKAWDKQCIIFTCHQREEEILKEEDITHQMIQI